MNEWLLASADISRSRSSSPFVSDSHSPSLLPQSLVFVISLDRVQAHAEALGDITAKAREKRTSRKDSRVSNSKKKETMPGMDASENRMPRDHSLGFFCSTLDCCCSPRRSPGPSAAVSSLSSTPQVEQSFVSFVHIVLNFPTLHVMANAYVVDISIQ